jgi:hypothetical protein
MHSAGFFMPPVTRKLAWTFCLLGALTLLVLPMLHHGQHLEINSRLDHLVMGFFFGLLHLGYGLYLALTKEPPAAV